MVSDLDDLLRDGAASWLLRAALRDLERRTRDGQPWPARAREVVDELARLADLAIPEGMSASGPPLAIVSSVGHLVPAAEAAHEVGCSPRHVRRLAADGRVRGRRVSRDWLVDLDSLRSVLARRTA